MVTSWNCERLVSIFAYFFSYLLQIHLRYRLKNERAAVFPAPAARWRCLIARPLELPHERRNVNSRPFGLATAPRAVLTCAIRAAKQPRAAIDEPV